MYFVCAFSLRSSVLSLDSSILSHHFTLGFVLLTQCWCVRISFYLRFFIHSFARLHFMPLEKPLTTEKRWRMDKLYWNLANCKSVAWMASWMEWSLGTYSIQKYTKVKTGSEKCRRQQHTQYTNKQWVNKKIRKEWNGDTTINFL